MPINFDYDDGGKAVDAAAKRYQQEHPGTTYLDACKHVLRAAQNRTRETRYSANVKPGQEARLTDQWKVYEENGQVVSAELGGTGQNINRLSNLIVGLPRLVDGSIDAVLAAQVVNSSFVSLGQAAAGDFLYAAAGTP